MKKTQLFIWKIHILLKNPYFREKRKKNPENLTKKQKRVKNTSYDLCGFKIMPDF